jgi:hypothetical protein
MSNSTFQFQTLDLALDFLEHYVKNVSESEALVIPKGFNNSILWNIGHIVTFTEKEIFGDTNREMKVPDSYMEMFLRGTKPADWIAEPPTLQTLLAQLAEQVSRIKETFHNRLDEKLSTQRSSPTAEKPATVGELLVLLCFHWGLHVSAVNSINRIIQNAKNSNEERS